MVYFGSEIIIFKSKNLIQESLLIVRRDKFNMLFYRQIVRETSICLLFESQTLNPSEYEF